MNLLREYARTYLATVREHGQEHADAARVASPTPRRVVRRAECPNCDPASVARGAVMGHQHSTSQE